MLRFIIAAILIVHRLIVSAQSIGGFKPGAGVANPAWLNWWPTVLGQSWLLARLDLEKALSWVSSILWLVGGLLLLAAGLSIFGFIIPQGYWRVLAVVGAAISLFLLLVYLHPFFGDWDAGKHRYSGCAAIGALAHRGGNRRVAVW